MTNAPTDPIVTRVLRIRHALGQTKNEDIDSIHVHRSKSAIGQTFMVDFGQGRTREDLETAAASLIANIASIRDHLKVWCKANGKRFGGDALIDTNRNVALVHDLWNIDKHAELNRLPRSGCLPKLKRLRQSMRLTTGSEAGSSVSMTFDPQTGRPRVVSSGGGGGVLVIDATVEDQNGSNLGTFQGVCTAAITAWEAELASVGVRVSSS